MTLYFGAGQPSDSSGSAGDYSLDGTNKFLYGPKTTTWNGTAISLIGPSGPALLTGTGAPAQSVGVAGQSYLDLATGNTYGPKSSAGTWGSAQGQIVGAQGLSVLTGSGAPSSSLGTSGQVYIDTANINLYSKSGTSWSSPTSLTGPVGYTALTTQAMGTGQYLAVANQSLSSTAATVNVPGTSIPSYYLPGSPSALMGLSAEFSGSSGASVTMTLYDQTASASVVSVTLTAATGYMANQYTATQYPLTQGHTYIWQLTGSGTATVLSFQPFYLTPSAGPTAAVQTIPGFWSPAGTSFSSTSFQLQPYALSTTGNGWHPVRAASLYRLRMLYNPSSAGAASATLTVSVNYYSYSASKAVTLTTGTVTNTGLPQYAGPFSVGTYVIPAAQSTYLTVTGSGTGQLLCDLELVI